MDRIAWKSGDGIHSVLFRGEAGKVNDNRQHQPGNHVVQTGPRGEGSWFRMLKSHQIIQ
jgi:hypothetical protein